MNIPIVQLSENVKKQIDESIKKYPENQKQSAIMPALTIVQKANNGHLTHDLIQAVAAYLEMPAVSALEVATFYSMYEHAPVGRHKIEVCANVSCMLRGCDELIAGLESKLGIKIGQTTSDKRFTLKRVECLAACDVAPALQINGTLYGKLDNDTMSELIDTL